MKLGSAVMVDFGLGEYITNTHRNVTLFIPEGTPEKYGQKFTH